MSLQNFNEACWTWLPAISDQFDIDAVNHTIAECFKNGWTIPETVKYCRCLEYITPSLDEDVAIRRMKEIEKAVSDRKALTS